MSGCRVYMHTDELPLTVALAAADYASFEEYANPVDQWAILPLLRIIPPLEAKPVLQEGSLEKVVRAFDPNAGGRGLTAWQCVLTADPHTGARCLLCPSDRVLIAGGVIMTVNLNSLCRLLFKQQFDC